MKKATLLYISLFSLSAMTIYASHKSGKYTENVSEVEYNLASIQNNSYKKFHRGVQDINEARFKRDSKTAQLKNNKTALLQQQAASRNTNVQQNARPVPGSAGWAANKNNQL
ncbi:MAG: hypothetical protein JO129_03455 [Candidatus Dependentiae bacterium]|nr:hypothetical protein [Candidatus Dependentiae bacterium]